MSKKKKRILITGVSGLLGNNLADYFKSSYDILGLYHQHPVSIDGVRTQKSDITSCKDLVSIVKMFCPDIVIHCASLTDVDFCQTHPFLAKKINETGTQNVVDSLRGISAKLIYISTDSVYDGFKGNFKETDAVNPLNIYGRTKLAGEKISLKRAGTLVLRTNIFGWNIQDKSSIAEWICKTLVNKKIINGFKDAYFSSIYTFELAKIIEVAFKKGLRGTYNCASSTSLSKYEFALELARQFGLDSSLIKSVSIDGFGFKAQRGKNLSLCVDKIQKDLHYQLPTMSDCIEHFYNDSKTKHWTKHKEKESSTYIPYGRHVIGEDDIQAVVEVLRSDWLTQGPKVQEFEDALCSYTGARYAVAVSNGTAALHIACLAAGLKSRDEFITSPNTFVASANCGVYCGARPVFADIDIKTYNIDPQEINQKITAKTRIIIPVHFAGQICDMEAIGKVVRQKQAQYKEKIYIIEDASHALGSAYKNSKAGACLYSDMTVMSFHPVKHIATAEGGVVFTNDEKLYRKLKFLRSHGITNVEDELVCKDQAYSASGINPWYYEQQSLGFNYRITDVQCALGISQLKKLESFRERRRSIVQSYNKAFAGHSLITIPYETAECATNWHLYVLQIDFEKLGIDRACFMKELRGKGIGTQVHYIPVHTQPFYKHNFGTNWGDCPNAEKYYRKCLSIPLFPSMYERDAEKVISSLLDLLRKYRHV